APPRSPTSASPPWPRPRARADPDRRRRGVQNAAQEAWLRITRADPGQVESPAGRLTTIVARVCLNMLQARRPRREEPAGALPPEPGRPRDRPGEDRFE
ncbi:hypothetical protein ACSNOI_12655, partial [Actinomadura kijaniata]